MKPSDVYGLYEQAAGEYLARLAAEVPSDQAIVEIGVFQARSLLYLAEGSLAGNKAKVHGIDPWNLPRPSKEKYSSDETYRAAKRNVGLSDAGHLVTLQRAFSVGAAARWRGPRVGLLHIDADHRYGPVLEDFGAWSQHLAPGAYVCFDDYHLGTFPGVVRAVDELVQTGRLRGFHVPGDCSRLAVTRLA